MVGSSSGKRVDPYSCFNFLVEIQGLIVAGFTEVSGLESTVSVETIKEGGVNNFEYKFPKSTSFSNLVFKRGLTDLENFWGWYQQIVNGNISRKNGTIYLCNAMGQNIAAWNFLNAWPTQWSGPHFDATSNAIATETFTLVHQGLSQIAC